MSHRGFNTPGDDHSTSPEPGGSVGFESPSMARTGRDHDTIVDQITEAARLRSEMIAAMKRRLTGGEGRPEERPMPPRAAPPEMEHEAVAEARQPEMSARGRATPRAGWAPRFAEVAPRASDHARSDDAREPRLSVGEDGVDPRPDDYLFSTDETDDRSPRDPAWDKAWNDAESMEHALVKFAEVLARDGKGKGEAPRRPVRRRSARAGFGRLFGVFTLSFLAGTSFVLVVYGWSTASGNFEEKIAPLVEGVVESVGTVLLQTTDGSDDPRVPFGANASTPREALGEAIGEESAGVEAKSAAGKPMETARLKVADAQGESHNEINLSLEVVPADPARPVDVRLTGLPVDAVLTRGERQTDGSWLLKPGDERDLFLSLPSVRIGEVLVGVEAVEQESGELAAPPQEIRVKIRPARVVVEPAAEAITPNAERQDDSATVALAAPEEDADTALPVPPSLPAVSKSGPAQQIASLDPTPEKAAPESSNTQAARTEAMIARGNALLEAGDIVSARSFFERAYRLGNERAARPLARTYDPLVLNSLGVKGLKADPAKALAWYAKARTAGHEEVAADIEALQAFLAD